MATTISDLLTVYIENKPSFFARIEDIAPDVKPGWWQVSMLVLTNPPRIITWILDEGQINGEPFTMGGTPVFLEKVISPIARADVPDSGNKKKEGPGKTDKQEGDKVVSLLARKKKP
ncbi:MAG: hypothetical protein PHG20_04765 [Geobacteraceae bacterium]|nr:hypothetical protein [Geobacteraceae bacterium]